MSKTKTLVLNDRQIRQKTTRMAYEIYERNLHEKTVVFAGITGMGYKLAIALASALESISPINAEVIEILLDKSNVEKSEIKLSKSPNSSSHCVIIVDDVLNTGKTLVYALQPFMDSSVRKIEIAVLVNRSHKLFPVAPDYTGLELATTLSEHITVDLESENHTVHLH
jgi:pyrimidine operon attenuation protein/uracil phosphoribosyltransferase